MGRMEWFNYLKKVFNKLIADNSSMSPEPTCKISITMMIAGIESAYIQFPLVSPT